MGQYHLIANLDKQQYISGGGFGDGIKLMEFGHGYTMLGLAVLLAADNGLGGGDFRGSSPLVGSWAGDRIIISGDYGDPGVNVPDSQHQDLNLYEYAKDYFTNISGSVADVLLSAGEMSRNSF